jgi:tetratricopeptide (TPR) repeat protein
MSQVWSDKRDEAAKACDEGSYEAGRKAWQDALTECEQFSKGDGRTVATLEGLAHCEYMLQDWPAAESLYKRALEIRETQQGIDHQDVATLLNNLGAVYFRRGHYKDAMASFERALGLRRKTFPETHLEVGKTLYHLALTCHAQMRYDEADGHYRKSLDIKNKSLGNNHPALINLLRNYAHLLRKTSRDSIAAQMEQFASGIEAKQKA